MRPTTQNIDWYQLPRKEDNGYVASTVANYVTRKAAGIENYNYQQRWRNTVYARLAMGRDIPMSFGLSMTRRVGPLATSLRNAPYVEPHHNVVALALDTFNNRIGTNKPWVAPQTSGGDFMLQTKANELRNIFAAQFDELKLYRDITPHCFQDMGTWGTTLCKVTSDLDRKKPVLKRVLADDWLVDEVEASVMDPRSGIHRDYMFRDDLLSMYEDDEDAALAIINAPSAFPGVTYSEGTSLDNIIYVLDAYKLPRANGEPGRRVLCLPNYVFEDEDWTRDHFPFAVARWRRMSIGYWGQGVPEVLTKIQQNIDRLDRTIIAQQIHGSVYTIMNRKGSGLVAQHFANKQGRVLQWDGPSEPTFHAPVPAGADLYRERDAEIQQALNFIGLSPQITSGARDPGITAGVAIRAKENQADARHLSPGQSLEQFVTDIAYLLLEVNKEIKPPLKTAGKDEPVDWDDYSMERGDIKLMAFPVSSIPNEPEGRYQTISEWFANGQINKQEKMLLDSMPDTQAYEDIATSMQRHAYQELDNIIEKGASGFDAPDAFENWDTVIQIAQSRLKQAQVRGVPQDRLRLVEQWIELCFDMKNNPGALPQPAGITPPTTAIQAPGQTPGTPPALQTAPSIPRPMQPAPAGAPPS